MFARLVHRGIIQYILKRISFKTVEIDAKTIRDFGLLQKEKTTLCIEDKLQYEREFNFFKKMIDAQRSKRIMGIVGLFHLKSLRKFFEVYEREALLFDVESYMDNLEFPTFERREIYEQAYLKYEQDLDSKLKFYEKFSFCNDEK